MDTVSNKPEKSQKATPAYLIMLTVFIFYTVSAFGLGVTLFGRSILVGLREEDFREYMIWASILLLLAAILAGWYLFFSYRRVAGKRTPVTPTLSFTAISILFLLSVFPIIAVDAAVGSHVFTLLFLIILLCFLAAAYIIKNRFQKLSSDQGNIYNQAGALFILLIIFLLLVTIIF